MHVGSALPGRFGKSELAASRLARGAKKNELRKVYWLVEWNGWRCVYGSKLVTTEPALPVLASSLFAVRSNARINNAGQIVNVGKGKQKECSHVHFQVNLALSQSTLSFGNNIE